MIRREVTVNCVGGLDARPDCDARTKKQASFESNVYIENSGSEKRSMQKVLWA